MGARVDGISISTGVASAGDVGKRPSDPAYRAEMPVTGRLSTTGLLGPFTNWVLGVLSAIALAWWGKANLGGLVLAASAISNGGIRIYPVCRFVASILSGKLWLDDEATWGLATNPQLQFPMTHAQLDTLMATQPQAITHYWAAYFWPAVSLTICVAVLIFAYPRAIRIFRNELKTRSQIALFVAIPFLITPLIILSALFLDERIRINW